VSAILVCIYVLLAAVALNLWLWGADRRRAHAEQLAAAEQTREREARAIGRIYYDWRDARDAEHNRREAAEHRAYMEWRLDVWYQAASEAEHAQQEAQQ